MKLPVHIALLAAISAISVVLCWICRRYPARSHAVRWTLGAVIAINEFIWWIFRYPHEGVRLTNLPLQLCDVTLWAAVTACFAPKRLLTEFVYFAGLAGAGMALITPDLWSPWPSYPATYFFVAHGGIVITAVVLVIGRIVTISPYAMWHAFGLLAAYAAFVGSVNAVLGTNYMYLCRKPGGGSVLDLMGPWPWYLLGGGAAGLFLFALLSLPVRLARDR